MDSDAKKRGVPDTITVDPNLLLPFSSREIFSKNVCGLPTCESNCERRNRIDGLRGKIKSERINHLYGSGGVLKDSSRPSGDLEWIVFRQCPSAPDAETVGQKSDKLHFKAHWYGPKDADAANHDDLDDFPIARFAFEAGAATVLKSGQQLQPLFAEYKSNTCTWIISWLPINPEEKDQTSLQVFRGAVFEEHRVWFNQLSSEYKLRLADLIVAYIDNKCGPYRRHAFGGEFGTFLCQAETELAKHEDTLVDFDIWFTSLDIQTRELRRIEGLDFLKNYRSESKHYKDIVLRSWSGKDIAFSPDDTRGASVRSYADFFTDKYRSWLLPDEVADGQMVFSLGEVAAYLFFWTVTRILADSSLFRERFQVWWSTNEAFEILLETPISLEPPSQLIDRSHRSTPNKRARARALSTEKVPCTFRELLEGFWLEPQTGFGKTVALEMATFLEREFSDTNSGERRGVNQLPMFSGLGWRWETNPPEPDHTRWQLVQNVLRALFKERVAKNSEDHAALALTLMHRCVFPMGIVLTSWPRDCRFYTIVPIWTATVEGRQLPVIYGHVFSRHPSSPLNPVLPILRIFARTIADSYYREQIRVADAWETTASWAHEVTNYMKMVIPQINNLRDLLVTASPEVKGLLDKSNILLSTLNNASKSVLDAVSWKYKFFKPGEAGDPRAFPPAAIADRVVESALQASLLLRAQHFYANFELAWTPHWSETDWTAARRELEEYWFKTQATDRNSQPLTAAAQQSELFKAGARGWRQALERPWVVWASALLREAIWNLRPFHGGIGTVISISYSLEVHAQSVTAKIVQQQQTTDAVAFDPSEIRGVRFANQVFGPSGAGFGEIDVKAIKCSPRTDGCYDSALETLVTFKTGR